MTDAARVLLVSDTHGFLDPRVEKLIDAVDQVVHVGDIGSGVAETIADQAKSALFIAGNAEPASTPWPLRETLALPGGILGVAHGHRWASRRRHARLRGVFPDARLVVCGHSHRRADDTSDMPRVINPGAAGKNRAYGGPSAAMLIARVDEWRIEWHIFEPLSARKRRR